MKAFLVNAPHQYALTDVPLPTAASDEALVRVGACGICGSDVDILDGSRPMEVTKYPVIIGHEFSGEIVEVGSEVTNLKPGDRVAVDTVVRCQTCRNCALGWTCHCQKEFHQLGCTKAGGMAEYVAVPQRLLYKLPEDMDLTVAALAEPASCAAHAVSKAEIRPGDAVVVIGAGPIGALSLQIARLFSPGCLIAVEIDEYKLQLARQLGATHTVNARSDDVPATVMDITKGLGADAVIECSGNVRAIQQSFSYLGTKARTVVIGVPPEPTFEIDFLTMLLRDSVFRSSNGYTTPIWLWALKLLGSGVIDAGTIITSVLPLQEVERGFSMLRAREPGVVKVMTHAL